jgi:hypothetical protein
VDDKPVTPDFAKLLKDSLEELKHQGETKIDESLRGYREIAEISKMRIAFFDRVIVFDTGVIAVSITYLASMGSHHSASRAYPNLMLLYSAWAFLVGSIVSAGFSNTIRLFITQMLFGIVGTQQQHHRTDTISGVMTRILESLNKIPLSESEKENLTKQYSDAIKASEKEKQIASARHEKLVAALPILMRSGLAADGLALLTLFMGLSFVLVFVLRTAWIITLT